jgi:hypothetical protein
VCLFQGKNRGDFRSFTTNIKSSRVNRDVRHVHKLYPFSVHEEWDKYVPVWYKSTSIPQKAIGTRKDGTRTAFVQGKSESVPHMQVLLCLPFPFLGGATLEQGQVG